MSQPDIAVLERALERERLRRTEAERLLEEKSGDLYNSFEALKNSHQQLVEAHKEVKNQQRQLVQSDKLASLGTMSAGVAHEINNPLSFVLSNVNSLAHSVDVFVQYHRLVEPVVTATCDDERQSAVTELRNFESESDLEFLFEDCVDLMKETREGIDRVKEIVTGLQDFARSDTGEVGEIDIHECIRSTLKLAHNQIKYDMTITEDFGDLPPIKGYAGKLSQVFLNLIVNASQSMDTPGNLTITTRTEGWRVILQFQDSGCGMGEETMESIFDPFFTTKEVGKGTGLGLSISHGIVEEHNGDISVTSEPGKGTCFTIKLPMNFEIAMAS
ncbi:MAG: ATP-binding protein [Pseudomonadota bacterium]